MDLGLKGKVAIVGGSSKGLGKACAMALAMEGAGVTIAARNTTELEKAAAEIRGKTGAEILPIQADQGKEADIKRIVDETVKKFGRLDILVTNTGGPPPGNFFDMKDEDWQAAYERLLLYVVRICRHVIPHMKRQGGGRIINNTSLAVKEPIDNLILSNVFRAGVVALSKTLSREVARDGILVNCVAPGFFRTDRMVQLLSDRAKRAGQPLEKITKEAEGAIPIGRMQEPEELGSLIAFLASDRASAITGAVFQVDGGMVRYVL